MHDIVPVVAISLFFITIMVFLGLFFVTRYRERMALMEYDKDASIFRQDPLSRYSGLKWGLVLVLGGLGLLLGEGFHQLFNLSEEAAHFSLVFMGAGAGLIIFYLITARLRDE